MSTIISWIDGEASAELSQARIIIHNYWQGRVLAGIYFGGVFPTIFLYYNSFVKECEKQLTEVLRNENNAFQFGYVQVKIWRYPGKSGELSAILQVKGDEQYGNDYGHYLRVRQGYPAAG